MTALIKVAKGKHGDGFAKELAKRLPLYMAEYAKGQGVAVVDFGGIVARKTQVDRLKLELDGTVSLSEGVAGDEWQQYHKVVLERYNPNKHKIKVVGQPADFAVVADGISPNEWLTIDFMMTVSSDKEKVGMNAMLLHSKKGKKAWDNLKLNIQKHLEKSDIIPLDLRQFDTKTLTKIVKFVPSLDDKQRRKVVIIKDK